MLRIDICATVSRRAAYIPRSFALPLPAVVAGQSRSTTSGTSAQHPFAIQGHVLTAYGQPVVDTTVSIGQTDVHTDQAGVFAIRVAAGSYELRVRTPHNAYRSLPITVHQDQSLEIKMPVSVSVIVRAGATAEILTADPATEAYDRKDLIAANPGRPDVPFAVPGFPPKQPRRDQSATILCPGVAGDHGKPIA
jgi:Carboxypeptidase regulatory-like domain